MANWKYKIDLKDIWTKLSEDEIEISEGGKQIAEILRKHKAYKEYESELEEIAMQFEEVETQNEFNAILQELYDWGDTTIPPMKAWPPNKIAWIATQF